MPRLIPSDTVKRRVIKMGGSMMGRPELLEEWPRWLDAQSPSVNFVIVGGGEVIEAIRRWDRVRAMPSEQIHWQCVDLLDTTFEIMSNWFPQWNAIESASSFSETVQIARQVDPLEPTEPIIHLIRCAAFYNRGASPGDVPKDWRTTTDTIAAVLGRITEADEVVLLKSCPIPETHDIQAWADQGIVDEALPMIANSCPPIRLAQIG